MSEQTERTLYEDGRKIPLSPRTITLFSAARMLSYPGETDFFRQLRDSYDALEEVGMPMDSPLARAMGAMLGLSPVDLEEHYVSVFDLSQETTLHLTAHEYGDGRQRGPALLELAQTFRAAGWMPAEEQLSDYLPQLLEFLGMVEASRQTQTVLALEQRISNLCRLMEQRLAGDGVYEFIFSALRTVLVPADETILARAEPSADFDSRSGGEDDAAADMPYPLHYESDSRSRT
ncbi:nitrate reductase molybdenum cofactor assembly chaperone [Alicyclobacillus sp. SP_1]|uniref:nitrate reductase molybdenum cofactor assembly chaperone n=1 Tax=Alicyclobacillus sp. SP_1 TaxID=2942475 RepID=UPI002157FA5C|nr:nitrate reductase molybdenum cofactor assembly chaperone [Alicyclobacillus sp. SP_1]